MSAGESALLIVAGAAIGAPLRYLIGRSLRAPWGIFTANMLGCLALGVLLGSDPAAWLLVLAGTGFCGAFTTFSTFALDAVEMIEAGAWRAVGLYLSASLVAGFAAYSLGYGIAGLT